MERTFCCCLCSQSRVRSNRLQLRQERWRSDVQSKMKSGRPWGGQFRKVIQAPLYEVTGEKPLSKEVQVESCLCGMDYVMSYVPRVSIRKKKFKKATRMGSSEPREHIGYFSASTFASKPLSLCPTYATIFLSTGGCWSFLVNLLRQSSFLQQAYDSNIQNCISPHPSHSSCLHSHSVHSAI